MIDCAVAVLDTRIVECQIAAHRCLYFCVAADPNGHRVRNELSCRLTVS